MIASRWTRHDVQVYSKINEVQLLYKRTREQIKVKAAQGAFMCSTDCFGAVIQQATLPRHVAVEDSRIWD
jgi:hypothetical protein